MAFAANVINVFVACPSDAEHEKSIIINAINDWNYSNTQIGNTRVVLRAYSGKNALPLYSSKGGQHRISSTILRKCDILIAVFKHKRGMPTRDYESGTIEEISLHVKNKKPAAVYLCHVNNEKERDCTLRKYIKDVLQHSHLYYPLKRNEDLREVISSHINSLLYEIIQESKFTLFDEKSNPIIFGNTEKIVTPCLVARIETREDEDYYKVLSEAISRKKYSHVRRRINDTTWDTNPDERDSYGQEAHVWALIMRLSLI